MKYCTIAIGDELLIGQVVDTNSGWIARHMVPLGFDALWTKVIADDAQQIRQAIDEALSQCDLVLMTGGLGPTKDDITKPTLCDYFGGTLVFDAATAQNVEKVVAARHLKLNDYTRAQAMVPSSCRIIQNQVGTAPIMWFQHGEKVLVSMPGVPHEMCTMMEREIMPQLMRHFHSQDHIGYRTFVVTGIIESLLAMKLDGYEREMPQGFHLAYLPQPGIIRLRLTGSASSETQLNNTMDALSQRLHKEVGEYIIADGDKPLACIVGERLREKNLTMATAESCTGGNIAHEITRIAGSSDYFVGSVVSYANHVKEQVLQVSPEDLRAHGAVSEPVVRQMAQGVCQALGANCAVATSGIAGPGGGTKDKPVGTVWMAAKCDDKLVTACKQFPGDRNRVIERATNEALLLLLQLLG